jgi:hypothetical protein
MIPTICVKPSSFASWWRKLCPCISMHLTSIAFCSLNCWSRSSSLSSVSTWETMNLCFYSTSTSMSSNRVYPAYPRSLSFSWKYSITYSMLLHWSILFLYLFISDCTVIILFNVSSHLLN